jgi:predicted nucleic acid-binding protein
MNLVIDASVALKWIIGRSNAESNLAEATAILKALGDGVHDAIQPVSRRDNRRIDGTLTLLSQTPHVICNGVAVMRRASILASDLDHHLFDTLYHAVALEMDATLITADTAYFRKAKRLGHIQQLAGFKLGRP